MRDHTNGIQLSASGTVTAPYDIVHLKTTISDIHLSGPEARASIEMVSKEAIAYVDGLVKQGLATNKVLALSIDPATKYVGNENVFLGYRASLQISFSTDKVNRAMEFQEKLTEFQKSKVASLVFGFKNVAPLQEKALEAAWSNLNSRFAFSKKMILGIATLDYDVVDWDIDYEEQRHISKVSAPTENEAGEAKVSVRLTVTWQKRKTF